MRWVCGGVHKFKADICVVEILDMLLCCRFTTAAFSKACVTFQLAASLPIHPTSLRLITKFSCQLCMEVKMVPT